MNPCVSKPNHASYPIGHSTVGDLFAIVLAQIVPEKSAQLFSRANEFAFNRVVTLGMSTEERLWCFPRKPEPLSGSAGGVFSPTRSKTFRFRSSATRVDAWYAWLSHLGWRKVNTPMGVKLAQVHGLITEFYRFFSLHLWPAERA